jgi:hypothetical protein
MPVVAWGNGGCSANGLSQQNFLIEVASWGFIVIASGGPNQQGSTTAAMMKASIDYASTATAGVFVKVNKDSIAAAGFSCGGIEAYEQAQDARVKALGIFNSGQMSEEGTRRVVPAISGKPVFFFLGGPSDIAYNNVRHPIGLELPKLTLDRVCVIMQHYSQASPPGTETCPSATVQHMEM